MLPKTELIKRDRIDYFHLEETNIINNDNVIQLGKN